MVLTPFSARRSLKKLTVSLYSLLVGSRSLTNKQTSVVAVDIGCGRGLKPDRENNLITIIETD